MKNIELVISRFNENIDWVKEFNYSYIIYNKGLDNINLPYISLPNIGRESHTYIHHIITNYNTLPEYIVFLQGCPFNHVRDIKFKIDNNSKKFEFVDDTVLLNDLNTVPPEHRRSLYNIIKKIGMVEYLINFINPTYYYGHGAQFIIHKDLIVNKSLDFWKKLLNVIEEDNYSPWTLERFFPYIFLNK